MTRETQRTFSHFSVVSFTPAYWGLSAGERRTLRQTWLDGVSAGADATHLYQTFAANTGDLLLWCAAARGDPAVPRQFFEAFGRATLPVRRYLEVGTTLWGFTRPSQYTKVRSTQELDPFAGDRHPYLIIYPFVKTTEWYLKNRSERQELMAQHIKVGKQYQDITQLLLYSFGLQDQEFVVVYETSDLTRFLALVEELRGTEARVYTLRDTPLHLGVHQDGAEALAAWL